MARKKDQNEIPLAPFDYQTPDEIEQFLGEMPEETTKISLWRVQPQGRPAFITYLQISDFDLDAIKNTYGGGTYKYIAKEGGRIVKEGRFDIDGPPPNDISPDKVRKYVPGVGSVFISKAEREAQKQLDNPPSANQHGGDIMLLVLQEMKTTREILQSLLKQPAQQTNEKDFLERLMIYKELFAGKPSEQPTQEFAKMATDLLKQGMEIASLGGEGSQPPWMMVLDKVLPVVNDALKVFTLQQQQRSVIRQPAPIPNPNGQLNMPPNSNPVPLTGFDALAEKLRIFLPAFLHAASNMTDPAIMVDYTIAQISIADRPTVVEWLKSENWFNDLLKLHPAIEAQRGWWQAFHDGLLDELENPDSGGDFDNVQ